MAAFRHTYPRGAMLHHVTLEITRADLARAIEFFTLVGFAEVPEPEPLRGVARWLERDGTQIHLLFSEQPVVPPIGHVALVAPDFEETLERLRAAGYAVERKRELWGQPRAGAIAPGGHRVELMAAPPAPAR